jgi:hypothetical protein
LATVVDDEPLSDCELEILVDGLSNEVAFIYVLSHLGLVDASEATPGSIVRRRWSRPSTTFAASSTGDLSRLATLNILTADHRVDLRHTSTWQSRLRTSGHGSGGTA